MGSTNPLHRKLILVKGNDSNGFLQGLLSIDVSNPHPKYGLIFNAKGRFQFDFFHWGEKGVHFLDHQECFSDDLYKFLKRYKLRADVELSVVDLEFSLLKHRYDGAVHAFKDPRHTSIGYRTWHVRDHSDIKQVPFEDYERARILAKLPEYGCELIPEKTIALEVGVDALGAIDYEKGCYLGQELQSRTKHTGILRKALYQFESDENSHLNSEIIDQDLKVGRVTSFSPGRRPGETGVGLCVLKKDHAGSKTLFIRDEEGRCFPLKLG